LTVVFGQVTADLIGVVFQMAQREALPMRLTRGGVVSSGVKSNPLKCFPQAGGCNFEGFSVFGHSAAGAFNALLAQQIRQGIV
jgi:hypothetical protein